jgi:hypothetical protein
MCFALFGCVSPAGRRHDQPSEWVVLEIEGIVLRRSASLSITLPPMYAAFGRSPASAASAHSARKLARIGTTTSVWWRSPTWVAAGTTASLASFGASARCPYRFIIPFQ